MADGLVAGWSAPRLHRNRSSHGIRHLGLGAGGAATPLVRTPFDEGAATFSPDGKWIAYTSNESSRDEVYVRAFPGPGPRYQVSIDGGSEPAWSRRSGELFYRQGARMMSVMTTTTPAFRAAEARLLFAGDYQSGDQASYAVTGDGKRFLMIRNESGEGPVPLDIVLNWFEVLKRRVPASGVREP